MAASQKNSVVSKESELLAARIMANCKNRWASQDNGLVGSNSEQSHYFNEFHFRLWSHLSHALSTGNEENLSELLGRWGQDFARRRVPLPQVIEKSGVCSRLLLEQALSECDNIPELNENPKLLHHFLSRFNRVYSRVNLALIQGYNAQLEHGLHQPTQPKTRAEQKAENLLLFQQLSNAIGPGQFSVHRYQTNSLLFNGPKEQRNCFYFIREGTVQLQEFLPDGRAVVLAILGRGEVFAQTQDKTGYGYFRDFQVIALRDTELVLMEEEVLRQVMERAPLVAMSIIKSFSSQIAGIQQVIEGLLSRDITSRLIHILLQLADEFGTTDGEGILIEYSLTHQQLADMLGSNRVTITRRLGDLQKQGLLRVNHHNIILYNREQLEQVAC
jgi:CRP-like cAMP-binding protein